MKWVQGVLREVKSGVCGEYVTNGGRRGAQNEVPYQSNILIEDVIARLPSCLLELAVRWEFSKVPVHLRRVLSLKS